MSMSDLGPNIRLYMKAQGISAKKLAEKVGIGQVAMSNILNGKSEPRSSTFISICKELGKSPDKLLAEPRDIKAIHFRTLKTMSAKERAAREILLDEIDRWLKDYQELESELDVSEKIKPHIYSQNPVKAAQQFRENAEIGKTCPINSIISLVEQSGIKVKLIPFGLRKTFGFSVDKQQGGPAIVINTEKGISIERQIFTAAHELGHLLMHNFKENISEEESKQIESEADQFAAEFLMPDLSFQKEWERLEGFDWRERVLEIKKVFKVSYKTVLKRLSDVSGKINIYKDFAFWYKKKYNHDLKDYFEPQALCAKDEGIDIGISISPADLGRFRKLVKLALEKEYISVNRAAGMLGISLSEMEELRAAWNGPVA